MGGGRPTSGEGERCTWCGTRVDREDGFRLAETPGERSAVFCRLEHLIPWAIQDAHWEAGSVNEPPSLDEVVEHCSHCGAELTDTHILLVRHRGEHRIADGFCSVDHMEAWAKAGGRWQ